MSEISTFIAPPLPPGAPFFSHETVPFLDLIGDKSSSVLKEPKFSNILNVFVSTGRFTAYVETDVSSINTIRKVQINFGFIYFIPPFAMTSS